MTESTTKYLPCRTCGGTGYYLRVKMMGSGKVHFDAAGEQIDASEIHDDLKYANGSRARCSECNTVVHESQNKEGN